MSNDTSDERKRNEQRVREIYGPLVGDHQFQMEQFKMKERIRLDHNKLSTRVGELQAALRRFAGLSEAVGDGMDDSVIIRCEVTAGDIRAAVAALESAPQEREPIE